MVASVTGQEGVYEVVSPLGEPVVKQVSMAPRLQTLEGKTIGEIWNGGFRGDESFPMIEKMLQERYPTVKMIPYIEFPLVTIASLHPETKTKTLQVLRSKLKEKGCDAAIVGNGC
ncbi:MAG: hypothetical protein HXY45_02760 [Syntrophaceae bacterium]|nr:hypothetical protein [Syntrophaceae bacterium]